MAEELIYGTGGVTTGAGSDLQQATNTARNMVTKYGMSSLLGPLYYTSEELSNLSSTSREAVEQEVRQMLTRAEENARRILSENAADLHKLANGLLEHETLTLAEIQELLASKGGKNEALK